MQYKIILLNIIDYNDYRFHLVMTSIEQFVEALHKLGYDDFKDIQDILNKGDRSQPKTVWGKMSITLFGKNKATNVIPSAPNGD